MMSEDLDSDQKARLWEHRLHTVDAFYDRLNFFLIFESVLLGVVGVLSSRPNTSIVVLKTIALLGFSLTVIWGYVQARLRYNLNDLVLQAKERFPEYKTTLERRKKGKWPISTMWLLTYVVPMLVALVWIVFLFFLG